MMRWPWRRRPPRHWVEVEFDNGFDTRLGWTPSLTAAAVGPFGAACDAAAWAATWRGLAKLYDIPVRFYRLEVPHGSQVPRPINKYGRGRALLINVYTREQIEDVLVGKLPVPGAHAA